MTPTDIAVLIASSATAGLMNAMAGGGTIVSCPTLLLLGEPAITANATSTVALLPGALASMAAFRREVATHREWLRALLAPSLLGGAIGAVALLLTPEKIFARLAPLLVLFATVLFMVQGMLAQRADRRRGGSAETSLAPPVRAGTPRGRRLAALALQFLTSIYGGPFGPRIGLLHLPRLRVMGLGHIC